MSLNGFAKLGTCCALFLSFVSDAAGQAPAAGKTSPSGTAAQSVKPPVVKQVDNVGLRKAITAAGKPLLVNFWATWCDPCREEFPDLVKLDTEYKGKIDFITISLDDVADINGSVVKFLSAMKAEMPAYLLASQDDDGAIAIVSKDFTGALPFTILYDGTGKQIYFYQGKVKLDIVRAEIDKLLGTKPSIGGSTPER